MKKLFLFLLLVFASAGLFAKTAVVYHTSDTHGFFYPRQGQGGFAALAAVLDRETAPYLLLDGGDFAEGTVEVKNSRGLKAVQLMNKTGYQAAALGNHEFAYGEEALENMWKEADFVVLAANLAEKKTGQIPAPVSAYKIFDVGGVNIAVIGLANSRPTRRVEKYTFIDPLDALERALQQVEKEKPDVVVVLAHDSLADDRPEQPFYMGEIGRRFSGRVHVVLGGHAHKSFSNKYINDVLFLEDGAHLQSVGKVTVTADDETGKFVSAQSVIIPLKVSETGENQKIADYAQSLKEPGMDDILGTTAEPLPKTSAVSGEKDGAAENWIADVARAYSAADVFVHNTAGVRTGLAEGPVMRRDLVDLFPFDDTVVLMEVDGKFLKQLVKNSLLPRNLLSYSGLRVTYRLDKKGRAKSVKIYVNGKKVKNKQKYLLATNSYLAGGGSEGKLFKTIPAENKKPAGDQTIRALLEKALASGPVRAPDTGRVRQLP